MPRDNHSQSIEAVSGEVPHGVTGAVQSNGPQGSWVMLGQGHDVLTVYGSNQFTFLTPLPPGAPYRVLVLQTSPGLRCSVINPSGVMSNVPVSNVSVHCGVPQTYTWPFDAGTQSQYTFDQQLNFSSGTVALMSGDASPRAIYADTPVTFTHLYEIDILGAPAGCRNIFTMTFSPDAVSWYYRTAGHWAVADGTRGQSMIASSITPELLGDYVNFSGPGTLYVKIFLRASALPECDLDAVRVVYDQNTAMPPEPLAAVRLAVSGYPTPRVAGVTGNVTVTAYDAYGAVATSYRGTVQLESTDPLASMSAPYTFTAGNAGVTSLPITLFSSGTHNIAATDTAVSSIRGAQVGIVVQPGAAAHLRLTGYPSPQNAGVQGNVLVTVVDNWNNIAVGYTGTVHLATDDSGATTSSNYTFGAADAGAHLLQATFVTPGTRGLSAQDVSTSSIYGLNAPIEVVAVPASHFLVTVSPNSLVAGQNSNIEIVALDNANHVVQSYTHTVALQSSDATASLPTPYTFVSGNHGDAMLSGAQFVTAGNQTVSVIDTNNASVVGTSAIFVVSPNTATHIAASGYPASVIAGQQANVVVKAYDHYNNIATSYTGSVHFTSTDPQASLPSNYTFGASDAGIKSLPVTLATTGNQTINVNDTVRPTFAAFQGNIIVNPNAAARFVLSGYASPRLAGAAGNLTITAFDIYNNIVTNYTGNVHLSSSDSTATYASNTNFALANAGSIQLPVTLNTSGNQTLSANDTAHSGVSGTLTVVVTPSSFTLGGQVTGLVAGQVTLSDGNDTLSLSNGAYTFPTLLPYGRVYTINLTNPTGQTCVFSPNTVNSGTMPAAPVLNANVTCSTNPTTHLILSNYATPRTAGQNGNIQITAYDANNGVAVGYTGTVHLTSTDPNAVFSPNFTFVAGYAGSANVPVTLQTTGVQAITGNDTVTPSISGTQSGIIVNPSAAVVFSVLGYSTPRAAAQDGNITVTAYDQFHNIATNYAGTIQVTSTDPNPGVPANYTFNMGNYGTASLPVTLYTAGTWSIKANDITTPSVAGMQNLIVVNAAARLGVAGYATPRIAGQQGNFTVTAYDAKNNIASAYRGTVHITSSDAAATLPGDYTFGSGDAGVVNLSATLNTAGLRAINANDTAIAIVAGMQNAILVNPNVPIHFNIIVPATMTAGTPNQITVQALDNYNNIVTNYNNTVSFSSSDPCATVPSSYTYMAADQGNKLIPTSLTFFTSGTQSIVAVDPNGVGPNSANVTVSPGSPNQIVLVLGSTATAGTSVSPNVTIEDAYGNITPSFTGTVTFTSTDTNPSAVKPSATAFTLANSGQKTFTNGVKFVTSGNQTLTITDATDHLASASQVVTVAPGAVTNMNLLMASSTTAGQTMSMNLAVYDTYGNLVPSYTGSVAFDCNDYQSVFTPSTYTFTAADQGNTTVPLAMLATVGNRLVNAKTVSSGNPNAHATVVVSAGALARLRFGALQTVTTGTNFNDSITGTDAYGNLVSTYTGSISISSSDPNGTPASGTPISVNLTSGGTAAINGLRFGTAGNQNLVATDGGGLKGYQIFSVRKLLSLTNGQNGNTLSGGQVGNNSGNPYYSLAGRFYHADSYYNAFYTWNTLPTSNVSPNASFTFSTTTSSTSISAPSSIVSDGNTGIFVVATGDNRVNHYNQIPTALVAVDSVVGQPNVTANAAVCSATGLNHPSDVALAFNANAMLVADPGNGRVLVYSPIPYTSGQAATMAIGQTSLSSCSGATSATRLAANNGYPNGIWTDGNQLAVSDYLNNRILFFKSLPALLQSGVSGPTADFVIGQPSFTSSGNPGTNPNAYTLYHPSWVTSDGTQLFISDTGSNRVLVYSAYPAASTPAANSVLGQSALNTGTSGSTAASLNGPSGLLAAGNSLFVGDHGNSRYVIYFSP